MLNQNKYIVFFYNFLHLSYQIYTLIVYYSSYFRLFLVCGRGDGCLNLSF